MIKTPGIFVPSGQPEVSLSDPGPAIPNSRTLMLAGAPYMVLADTPEETLFANADAERAMSGRMNVMTLGKPYREWTGQLVFTTREQADLALKRLTGELRATGDMIGAKPVTVFFVPTSRRPRRKNGFHIIPFTLQEQV